LNTFLPFPDYAASARSLDRLRLGKQRSEVLIMIRGGWKNHPASRMWHGHFYHLGLYGIAVCNEWISRGYNDTCLDQIATAMKVFPDTGPPTWIGDNAFHVAHQSNLVRKMPQHYSQQFPGISNDLPYVWPKPAK
jgi:hypothetical protein